MATTGTMIYGIVPGDGATAAPNESCAAPGARHSRPPLRGPACRDHRRELCRYLISDPWTLRPSR